MSVRHHWMKLQAQREAELAAQAAAAAAAPAPTPAEVEQAARRAAAPDLGRDAAVIDLYGWARANDRDGHLADTRTYIGLVHMNRDSHGMASGQQAKLPVELRRAS